MLTTLLPLVLLAPVQDVATVEPFELTLRRPVETPGIEMFGEPGIELKLALHTPGRSILGIDEDATKLVRWVDDVGTDLAAGVAMDFFFWAQLEQWGQERKESTVLTLSTETVPSAKARELVLSASVGIVRASKSATETKSLTLKEGQTVTIAGLALKLSSVTEDGEGLELTLESSSKLDLIREVAFLDAAGEVIETKPQGSGSFGFGDKWTYNRSWGLARKVQKVRLRVTYWSDLETIQVPVDLKLGAGF